MSMISTTRQSRRVQPGAKPLRVDDFQRLDVPLLNPSIRTSQAMAWFNDRVILGTGRAPLGFLGRFTAQQGEQAGGHRADTGGRDQDGAQVLAFDPLTETWDLAFESPIIRGRDGQPRARDRSVRAIGIAQCSGDSAPTLYLGLGSLEGGVVILRSPDGKTFQECPGTGLGMEGDLPSIRTILGWNGRVYTAPTGRNYGRGMFDDNMTDFPMVYECADPMSGRWTPICEPGFGDSDNLSINELAAMGDYLYAATHNPRYGYQLWKTDRVGKPPYRWQKVLERGAWRGPASALPSAMYVFRGALYVAGAIQRQGRGGRDRLGPFPGELIRVNSDDTWELVAGTARFTPSGLKRPVSGMTAGFNDRFTHVFWRFAEYQGVLYLGTSDWRWAPTYLVGRDDLSPAQTDRLREQTRAYRPGAFGLWATHDGAKWQPVTTTGFVGSSETNYGIRELLCTPFGLFVAPTAKMGAGGGGGLELWWGYP